MSELKDLMLRPSRLTLAVAESLTCGRVQARVGTISGARSFSSAASPLLARSEGAAPAHQRRDGGWP